MMSPAPRRKLGGLILVLATLAAAAAQAQPQPARLPAALIVDMAQILQEAKAGKEVQSTINQQYAAYSKEVAQQEDELQKGGAELERQRTVLAPELYNTRARELPRRRCRRIRYENVNHIGNTPVAVQGEDRVIHVRAQ